MGLSEFATTARADEVIEPPAVVANSVGWAYPSSLPRPAVRSPRQRGASRVAGTSRPSVLAVLRLVRTRIWGSTRPRHVQALLQETGMPFAERVTELRLRRVRAMLQSADHHILTISEMAYGVGFNDLSISTVASAFASAPPRRCCGHAARPAATPSRIRRPAGRRPCRRGATIGRRPPASTGGRSRRRRSYFGVNIPVDAPSIVFPLASLF